MHDILYSTTILYIFMMQKYYVSIYKDIIKHIICIDMNDDVIQLYNIRNIDEINQYIDRMPDSLTHYDASIIIYMILKNMYRYIGNGRWEYMHLSLQMWKADDYKRKMKSDIRTIVSDVFLKRSMYWYDLSKECSDINEKNAKNYVSNKFLYFSSKMQNDKFISIVIKEAQAFFDIHRND
jgi:hypothetical protein